MSKQYKVNVVYVARFLYSKKGYKFLENQTKSYFPYWGMKKTAVQALRSAIVSTPSTANCSLPAS